MPQPQLGTVTVPPVPGVADAAPKPASATLFQDVVTGRFDAQEEDEEEGISLAGKRILAPQAESPKLHKVLAQAGMGSRLEMEQLIMEGRITVNNEPAHIGQRIQFGDHVKVNGKPIRFRVDPPPPRVVAYHKPTGEVVTHDDPQNRPTVFRRLPKLQQGKWQSVGRLDLNTEGLLLFTNSGELANNLMHPRFGLEREYAVRVLGALSNDEKQKLLGGVRLDDGVAQFGSIEDGGGEGANCWYRVTISEGRNREVRRMLEAVGHAVSRLIRIRYGAMVLPRGLKRGAWMELDGIDIHSLRLAAGAVATAGAPNRGMGNRSDSAAGNGAPGNGRSRRRSGRAVGERRPAEGASTAGGAPNQPRSTSSPGQPRIRGRADRGDRGDQGDSAERADQRAAESQPDPMKTSFGYIGAESFTRQRQGDRSGQRGGGRGQGGTGGGGGGGGGRRGGRGR
ncbi:MAG: rRNA pseudouridine synthase [Rhodoferax sp.]|nr:rRNA pseudouridine synthase [Rhodoferax sp.]